MPSPESKHLVGRSAQLRHLEVLLEPDSPVRVGFVHGPGGIGKTALVRELQRRARASGWRVFYVDARVGPAASDALAVALEAGDGLIVLDTYEHALALGGQLRAELGRDARAVVAGREPPEAAWAAPTWANATRVVHLRPLSPSAARDLIRSHGVVADTAISAITRWGQGLPLALELAADAVRAGDAPDLQALDADVLLATALLEGKLGDELGGAERAIIEVAATARAVDARLLAAALPGVDGDHAEAWVRGLSCAEPFGTRVTLHERVRKAVGAHLREHAPVRDRDVRRRLADTLYARATLGETVLVIDLAELIADEAIRWGVAPSQATRHRVAPGDPADLDFIAAHDSVSTSGWRSGLRRWFTDAPNNVFSIRDAQGELAAYGVWLTRAAAPAWADTDPVARQGFACLARHGNAEEGVMLRDSGFFDVPDGEASEAVGVANLSLLLRCGLGSPRYACAFVDRARTGYDGVRGFLEAFGYRHVPEFDARDADRVVDCFFSDWGVGGSTRAIRDVVYADIGLEPPDVGKTPAALPLATVRDALRGARDSDQLAASPLARQGTPAERAAEVRAVLERATDAAFGDSFDERLQRATVQRGYLDADGGHAVAAAELRLSRTAYFRRLGEAATRVATFIVEARA